MAPIMDEHTPRPGSSPATSTGQQEGAARSTVSDKQKTWSVWLPTRRSLAGSHGGCTCDIRRHRRTNSRQKKAQAADGRLGLKNA